MPETDGERLRLRATIPPKRHGSTVELQECDEDSSMWMSSNIICDKQLMFRNITRICEQIGK